MATGEPFDCALSSPPYGDQQVGTGGEGRTGWRGYTDHGGGLESIHGQLAAMRTNDAPNTFWGAAKQILEQVHAVLKPGGIAIFVLKAYVREGKLVDFPQQWRTLCEHVGFVTLHEHHALLVDEHREMGLFGEEVAMYRTSSKSFFRRLCEAKGSPEINAEIVLCMRKPLAPLPPDEAWTQLELVDGCLSSPPYAGAGEILGTHNGIDYTKAHGTGQRLTPGRQMYPYGRTDGQLGAMRPGDMTAVMADCVVSSPPYAESVNSQSHGIDWSKAGDWRGGRQRGDGTKHEATLRAQLRYGNTDGQLGAMPPGEPPSSEQP